jgi:hypothetical protein
MGSLYFILLGITNMVATMLLSDLHTVDFIILAVTCIPVIINSNVVYLLFGIMGAFISLYMGIAGLAFNVNPAVVHTSQLDFVMGYLLAISCFIASSLWIYAAVNDPRKSPAFINS